MFSVTTIIGLFLIAMSIYLIHIARGFPEAFIYKQVGPSLWPTLVLLGIIACGVLHIFRSPEAAKVWKVMSKEKEREENQVLAGEEAERPQNIIILLVTMALAILLILLSSRVGFIIAAPPVIFLMMLLFGARRIPLAIVLSLGFTAFIVFLFVYLLEVSLPRGVGIFKEINIVLSFL